MEEPDISDLFTKSVEELEKIHTELSNQNQRDTVKFKVITAILHQRELEEENKKIIQKARNTEETYKELPNLEKVNSWRDLSEEVFLYSLEDQEYYEQLCAKYPNADLKLFSKVQSYYADGKPATIAGWNPYTGDLELHQYGRGKDDATKLTRGKTSIVPGVNLNKIKLYRDNAGNLYVSDVELKRMFSVEGYLQFKRIVGSTATLVLEMLNMLPAVEEPKQLRVYEKDGRFYLPDKSEIFVRDPVVQNLVNSFGVVGSREEYQKTLRELWSLLSQRQRADFVALLGIPLINLLIDIRRLSYTKSYMLSYGSTKSGKTWLYRIAMKLLWGFDLKEGNAFWQGDSIGSQYRLHAILSSTNLPIYIDEVESRSKEIVDILKSAAVGATSFRGTAAQSQITYLDTATLTATAQSNVYLSSKLALADELAILRRFYYNNYEQGDADKEKINDHDVFESNLKVRGLVFDILSQYTVDKFVEIINEIMRLTGDDTTMAGVILGAVLLGLSKEEFESLKWSGNKDLTAREEIYELIRRDAVIVEQATLSHTLDKDYSARALSTLLGIKEKDGRKYIVLTSAYINQANSQINNPLKDKFHALSDLKELEPLFSEEELKALPVRVYDRSYRERFNGKVMSVAVLPYEYSEVSDQYNLNNITQGNTNVTQNVTHTFISINNKMLHSYTINNTFYTNSIETPISTKPDLCNEPQNSQNSSTLSRQNSENMENEVRNDNVTLCNEPQNNNATPPQDPSKPNNTPADPPPHFDAQAQANPQALSPLPVQPALENHNANTAADTTTLQSRTQVQRQIERTSTAPAPAPQTTPLPDSTPTQAQLTNFRRVMSKVYRAVLEANRQPFWQDAENLDPNPNLLYYLVGLTGDQISNGLAALVREGYVAEVRENVYKAVKEFPAFQFYSGEQGAVICPQCGKATAKLYDYAGDWLCVDCLNERQHSNEELYS